MEDKRKDDVDVETKERKKKTSRFVQALNEEIERKRKQTELQQQFQDLHWDDVYSVYYDTSIS